MRMGIDRRRNARQGSALIVVLWTTGLLAMLTATLAFESHLEARITNYYRNRTLAYYHARSGLSLAQLLIRKSNKISDTSLDETRAAQEHWYEEALRLKEGGFLQLDDPFPEDEAVQVTVAITPEPARRNINKIAQEQDDASMERILDMGGIPQELWPLLIDGLYDWVDADDDPRPDGAETDDFYANQDTPYMAKNGLLDTVGEMLQIRGYTREILEGGRLTGEFFQEDEVVVQGIGDMLTVHGDGKVNVNAASRRVLMTIPEMEDLIANDIVQLRGEWVDGTGEERQGFRSEGEFFQEFPDFPEASRKMIAVDSKVFRIESVGNLYGVRHAIWCTVQHSGGNIRILEWREDD